MTGMYQSRDILFLGRLMLWTMGPRKFQRGPNVSERFITPPNYSISWQLVGPENVLYILSFIPNYIISKIVHFQHLYISLRHFEKSFLEM